MARLDQRHPLSVEGDWFTDTRCIDCDVARQYAPELIEADDEGLSWVSAQPRSDADEMALWRASLACPTQSIGTTSRRRAPARVFPWELAAGVSLCGYNDRSSFGAHSYFVQRDEGNVMVDSPRYVRALVEVFEERGGIDHVLLTHQDDVADADRYADHFGAKVWIHEADARAAPYATEVVEGAEAVEIWPGFSAIPVPGHTRGSMVFHLEDRFLFTGDSMAWSRRRRRLDVFARATWYSWEELRRSMASLVDVPFEWVLPGHGTWHRADVAQNRREMQDLVADMTTIPRSSWRRPPS